MGQISLTDPTWQTTFPHRVVPRDEEWLPGLLLRCDEVNHWETRTTLHQVLQIGPEKFHRCWRTDTPNLIVILPNSINTIYIAQLLLLSPLAILNTTYNREIEYSLRMRRPHPQYIAHTFSFRLCPACINENRMLRREVVLPYLKGCSEHHVAFVHTCECGATLRLFKKHTQPFTCYNCMLDWGQLPRVQISIEEVMTDKHLLSWYQFFFCKDTGPLFQQAVKLLRTYPVKRRLVSQKDLARPKRRWGGDHYPFPISLVAASLVERDLFADEETYRKLDLRMGWRVTFRGKDRPRTIYRRAD